jgi:hypothetical protein
MHEVPGEGKGKQKENRKKRGLAGKRFTHVNGSPIWSRDFACLFGQETLLPPLQRPVKPSVGRSSSTKTLLVPAILPEV